MAQPVIRPVTSGVAPRQGFMYGALIGMLSLPTIAFVALNRLGGVGGGQVVLIGFTVVAMVLMCVAGLVAARRTGYLSSGVVAGVISGAMAGFIAVCLGTVIIILVSPALSLHAAHLSRLTGRRAPGPVADIIRLLIGGVLLAAIGLIMGTLGGLIGRIGRGSTGNVGGSGAGDQAPAGYVSNVGLLTTSQGYQASQPTFAGQSPLPADSDFIRGPYPAHSLTDVYRGDDPTTMMPNPLYPTPIPDDPTATPGAQSSTSH